MLTHPRFNIGDTVGHSDHEIRRAHDYWQQQGREPHRSNAKGWYLEKLAERGIVTGFLPPAHSYQDPGLIVDWGFYDNGAPRISHCLACCVQRIALSAEIPASPIPAPAPRKKAARPVFTEEQFHEYREENMGFCRVCRDFTADSCEPDARHYTCPECSQPSVFGAEQALLEGMLTLSSAAVPA